MTTNNIDDAEHDQAIQADIDFCRGYVAKANRGIVKIHKDLGEFEQSEHSAEIKAMSHGMTITEICDFYGLAWNNLIDNDKFFLCAFFLKGRSTGTYNATQSLFSQMNGRDGVKASLAYLSRFGENWENIEETSKKLDAQPKAIRIELIGD